MKILVDLTRTLSRRGQATGVDRVELNVVRELANLPGIGLLGSILIGPRVFALGKNTLCRVLQNASAAAPDEVSATDTMFLRALANWVDHNGAKPILPTGAAQSFVKHRPRLAVLIASILRGMPHAPEADLYLKLSHDGLESELPFARLRKRGLRIVFFLHDLQPIDYPEFFAPGERARHQRRLATIARTADTVLVNSEDTARKFHTWLHKHGFAQVATVVMPLGIEPCFLHPMTGLEAKNPFFVAIGTRQPRKNHQLLLNIWREMATDPDSMVPKLLLVGRPGWANDLTEYFLQECRSIQPHVLAADFLGDTVTAALMTSASALLMPSFDEGYGMPIVEARALGCRVVAADIPAHREVSDSHVTLIDPLDGCGWKRAILSHAHSSSRTTARQRSDKLLWPCIVSQMLTAVSNRLKGPASEHGVPE